MRDRALVVLAVIPLVASVFGLYRAAMLGFDAWGMDFLVYWDAIHRWAAGGPYYQPWQLAPYAIHGAGSELAVLMPPSFIPFAAPFAVLPRALAGWLWVAVPPTVIAWAVWRMRPPRWSWPVLALLMAWPTTGLLIATGNPTVAVTAALAVALATRHRWLAVAALVKPTLAPFALVGVRSRAWWLAAALLALAQLPLLPLWSGWLTAIANAQDGGLLYSLPHLPTVVLPVVAWATTSPARRCGSCRT